MNTSILVVDDNPDNMKLARWTLEDEGYDVTEAVTAEEALDLATQRQFDFVLMDISLPGMDGKEAIRRLRDRPEYETAPIFAVTAHAISEEQAEIQAAGVSEIIHKPIQIKLLLETIQHYLCKDVADV